MKRYSLRFLLFAILVVAIALAYATNTLNTISRDHERLKTVIQVVHPDPQAVQESGRASIAGIAPSGGLAMVTFEKSPVWLERFATFVGRDTVPQITEVQLIDVGFNDAQLSVLSKLSTLKSIDFNLSQVTDDGLAKFCENSHAESIRVGDRNVHITKRGRDLAAAITRKHGYDPKWPPTE